MKIVKFLSWKQFLNTTKFLPTIELCKVSYESILKIVVLKHSLLAFSYFLLKQFKHIWLVKAAYEHVVARKYLAKKVCKL